MKIIPLRRGPVSIIYYTRTGSSIKRSTLNKEFTIGHVNLGVVHPVSSYKISLPLNERSLNRCVFMDPTVFNANLKNRANFHSPEARTNRVKLSLLQSFQFNLLTQRCFADVTFENSKTYVNKFCTFQHTILKSDYDQFKTKSPTSVLEQR